MRRPCLLASLTTLYTFSQLLAVPNCGNLPYLSEIPTAIPRLFHTRLPIKPLIVALPVHQQLEPLCTYSISLFPVASGTGPLVQRDHDAQMAPRSHIYHQIPNHIWAAKMTGVSTFLSL